MLSFSQLLGQGVPESMRVIKCVSVATCHLPQNREWGGEPGADILLLSG